jgi:2-amino-4-hydroxy-6-hydroxymethyldihydropteridine diphosphokinase
MRVTIGLGSNLGERETEVKKAVEFLGSLGENLIVSSLYESAPEECPEGASLFVNAVAEMNYKGGLFALLRKFMDFETQRGRPKERPRNAPRPIDLDILLCEDLRLQHPLLTVPHPLLARRHFVLKPLAEIRGELEVAGLDQTIAQLLAKLEENPETMRCKKIG